MKGRNNTFRAQTIKTELDLPNYGEALRLLKNTESLLEKKKKQMRVKAMRSRRGSWIQEEEEHKKKIREEARNAEQKILQQLKALKQKERERRQHLRKQTERIRKENLTKRSQSKLEIIENKLRIHEEIRQKSQEHDQRVRQFKRQMFEKKKEKCSELYQDLRSSRAHVSEYQKNHLTQVRSAISRERDDLMVRIKKRQKELQELNQEIINHTTLTHDKDISTTELKSSGQTRKSSYFRNRKKSSSEVKIYTRDNKIKLFG